MEDLVSLVVIVIAVGFAVMVALALTALAGAAAAACVFGAATHGFFLTLWRAIVHRGGATALQGPDEPAFRAYYRAQVWRDLKTAATTAWQRATAETARIQALVGESSEWYMVLFRKILMAYGYIGLAVGTALGATVGLVPAALIMLFAGTAWAIGAPLRALERARRKRQGTHFDCPECHYRFALPVYVCPGCGAKHAELAPGVFGVLRHRCTCAARLPAVQWLGRERLDSECPAHGHPLGEGVGSVRTFHVPVAGGPSTGKSAFLAAAMLSLEQAAAAGDFTTSVQSSSRDGYDRLLDGFGRGVLPTKTVDLQAPALVAEVQGKDKSALLYAYDVAGEAYADEHELRRDPGYGLAEGVVLLIDPFALERIRNELAAELSAEPNLRPSGEAPQRVLERLVGVLDEKGIDLGRVPAAFCITKCDALDVGATIDAMPGVDDDARVRAWLEAQGAGNLVRAGEGTFKEIRCFSTTALGRTPDDSGRPFTPKGTLEPLLWLLSTAGVEPAAAGDAQRTRTERLAGEKPLNTSARRPLFAGAINAITPWPLAGDFAAGLAAFVILVLASAPLLQLVGVGSEPTYAVQSSEPIAAQPSASPPPSAASSAPPSSPAPSSPAAPSSPPAPAPPPVPENSYTTSAYSLTPPDGWIRDRDEKPFPGYVSSEWHVPGHSEVYLKVDYTPGYTGTPGAGARSVRNLYPGRVSDYRELGWGATKINGHTAWRWQFRFEDHDVEKVDWFFSACSTGIALLGAAPPAEFDQYLATFQQTVQSLRFACE